MAVVVAVAVAVAVAAAAVVVISGRGSGRGSGGGSLLCVLLLISRVPVVVAWKYSPLQLESLDRPSNAPKPDSSENSVTKLPQ